MAKVSRAQSANPADDDVLIASGYKPQLKRSLGYFASFAVSFSFISITTGIFAYYGYALTKGGPFGMWTWVIVALGQILVALVYADLAGRMPLAGCAYNWNTKLMNKGIGWITGWLVFASFSIGTVAVTTTAVPILATLLGVTFDATVTRVVGVGLLILQAIINIYGVGITSRINIVAVISEIVSIVVMGLLILGVAFYHGDVHPALLTTIPDSPQPYWPGFIMAFLLGAWGIVGFETSADMSEETINAHSIAPRGVISSVLASTILGFAFIVALTLVIPNTDAIAAADNPLIAIINYHLGDTVTKIFLVFVVVAIFSCSLMVMAGTSRVLFAMARDGRFIAPKFFARVSAHKVPKVAILSVTAIAIVAALFSDSLTTLFAATAILPAVIYLLTIVSFVFGSKKLPTSTSFSLGRWHWPVIIAALIWLVCEIAILTIPDEFHSAAEVTFSILILGIVLYFGVIRRKLSTSR
jgi:amino acid transporter